MFEVSYLRPFNNAVLLTLGRKFLNLYRLMFNTLKGLTLVGVKVLVTVIVLLLLFGVSITKLITMKVFFFFVSIVKCPRSWSNNLCPELGHSHGAALKCFVYL